MKNPEKVKQGKRNKAKGMRFERAVREDLTKKGWTVDKFTNNVDLENNKLVAARQGKFRLTSTGFPDFLCYGLVDGIKEKYYIVHGVEVKSTGYLSKEEKEKCSWLLQNNIFSKILIAKKSKKRGKIEYIDFIEKYGNK